MGFDTHNCFDFDNKPSNITSLSVQGDFSEGLTPKKKKGKWFVITMFAIFLLPLFSIGAYYTTKAIINAQRKSEALSAASEACNIDSFSKFVTDSLTQTISIDDETVFPKDKKSFMRILSSASLVEESSPVAFNKESDVFSSLKFPEEYDLRFSVANYLNYSYTSQNPYFGYDFYLSSGDKAYLIHTTVEGMTLDLWSQWGLRSVAGRSYSLTDADYQDLIDFGNKCLLG